MISDRVFPGAVFGKGEHLETFKEKGGNLFKILEKWNVLSGCTCCAEYLRERTKWGG